MSVAETEITKPWTLDSSQVRIIDGYAAKIIGEKGDDCIIEFHDRDMSIVEAYLSKKEFADHPVPPSVGLNFALIFFMTDKQLGARISAWPVKRHWHESLRDGSKK